MNLASSQNGSKASCESGNAVAAPQKTSSMMHIAVSACALLATVAIGIMTENVRGRERNIGGYHQRSTEPVLHLQFSTCKLEGGDGVPCCWEHNYRNIE